MKVYKKDAVRDIDGTWALIFIFLKPLYAVDLFLSRWLSQFNIR